jgi:hypothetical protein
VTGRISGCEGHRLLTPEVRDKQLTQKRLQMNNMEPTENGNIKVERKLSYMKCYKRSESEISTLLKMSSSMKIA